MNAMKWISGAVVFSMMTGCASMDGVNGPRLVGGGRSTEYEQYAEVGVEFSSVGDLMAIVSPSRWKSPIKTGGSLSWVNPAAWSEDPGRTSRILIGQAAVVGGAVAVAAVGSSSGDEGSSAVSTGPSGPTIPVGGPPSTPF